MCKLINYELYNMISEYEIGLYEIGYSAPPTTLTQDPIVFDGYSLQSSTIVTSEIDYDDQKNIELNTFKFPRINGGGVLSKPYRGRTITLKGVITVASGGDASDFNDLLDEIRSAMRTTEGNLDIYVNTEIRRIKATMTSFVPNRKHYNTTFCDFVMTFQTVEPFFYAINNQSQTYTSETADFTESFVHEGNADASPSIYFIFGAGTTATALSFTDAQGNILSITTAITN